MNSANSQSVRQPLTDPKTGKAIPPREQPGYYPRWDVLSQQAYWDAATRQVVLDRMVQQIPIRFFSAQEALTMGAVLDRILPQEDRVPERRIPLLGPLDKRLFENVLEGYRYEDMPPDQQAYRIAAEAFERMAQELHSTSFHLLDIRRQEELIRSIHDGEPCAAKEVWSRMNVDRFWPMLVSDACTAYYSHPWSWSEVGYGGPAYPRGYMRLEEGEPEPWEFGEERYEWNAPADTISDVSEPEGKKGKQQTHSGQAGTH